MAGKIGLVIAGTALMTFFLGRVEGIAPHPVFGGSLAWAEGANDQADDGATGSQNDASEQDGALSPDDGAQDQALAPDASDGAQKDQATDSRLGYCIKHPFPASGLWSGTVMDNNQGAGEISASLFQCFTKLSGTWQDTFVPPAFWKGTIKSSGNVKAQMRFHITGKCGYSFTGVFQNGNEISGNYTLHNCKGMGPDSGSFDMFKQ